MWAMNYFAELQRNQLNPRTGVGSKMTPGFIVKAWHSGEIEVTAMAFH